MVGFQVDLSGQIFYGRSVRNILVREAKKHDALALVVGYVEIKEENKICDISCYEFSLSDFICLL